MFTLHKLEVNMKAIGALAICILTASCVNDKYSRKIKRY